MTLILHVTNTGIDAEQKALLDGTALSPASKILIGSGAPHAEADISAATSLVQTWRDEPIVARNQLSDNVIQFSAVVGTEPEGQVTEIGLQLEDGTLYAYAPFRADVGGFLKGRGFSWKLNVLISRTGAGEITVKHEVVDVDVIAAEISAKASAEIDGAFTDALIAITSHLSSLNRENLEITSQLHAPERFPTTRSLI